MKKILIAFQLILLVASLNSCKKKAEPLTDQTSVNIIVKDGLGVIKSNWTVYQITDDTYNLYGTDEFFKDQQSVTNTNGSATFQIKDLFFATGGQRTYYFFAKYMLGNVNKVKTVGITLSQNDKKTETLILN
jgi:uncharacterized protein YigE (DUF2233 family)